MVVLSTFSGKKLFYVCMLYAPRSCMLFVIVEDDDATPCAFSRKSCEVSGTAVKAVSGGLSHSGKYDFLNIVKTNILLRLKKNIINFYFYYFICWFTRSDNGKHRQDFAHVLSIIGIFREQVCLQSKSSMPYQNKLYYSISFIYFLLDNS